MKYLRYFAGGLDTGAGSTSSGSHLYDSCASI